MKKKEEERGPSIKLREKDFFSFHIYLETPNDEVNDVNQKGKKKK